MSSRVLARTESSCFVALCVCVCSHSYPERSAKLSRSKECVPSVDQVCVIGAHKYRWPVVCQWHNYRLPNAIIVL